MNPREKLAIALVGLINGSELPFTATRGVFDTIVVNSDDHGRYVLTVTGP